MVVGRGWNFIVKYGVVVGGWWGVGMVSLDVWVEVFDLKG